MDRGAWQATVHGVAKSGTRLEGNSNSLHYSCLENPHGQGNLAGCSPWSHKESNTAEQLILSFTSFFFQQVTESLPLCMPPELCVGSGF